MVQTPNYYDYITIKLLPIPGDILFDFEMGSVTMLPATSRVTSNKFTPLLVLAEPLQPGDDEVTFLCTLTQLNSTDEVQSFLDRAECTVPESGLATTPNPTGKYQQGRIA